MSVNHRPGRICAGVDWAKDDHAVCIVGDQGEAVERFTVTHDAAGLATLVRRLLSAGVTEVGIERPDGPVVETLLQAELTVLVIPPGQLKNLRSRYGSAGNKDDRFDAYVLGDVVRTTGVGCVRWCATPRPLPRCARSCGPARISSATGSAWPTNCAPTCRPPTPLPRSCSTTSTPRSACGSSNGSTPRTRPTGCRRKRLAAWLRSVGYSGRTDPAALHAKLTDAPRGATGEHALIHAATTAALVEPP